MFLGVMKAFILSTEWIFHKKKICENKIWKELVSSMQRHQGIVNHCSIDWCSLMRFFGKEETMIGTASWQLEHDVTYTRLHLYHFGHVLLKQDSEEYTLLKRQHLQENSKVESSIKAFKCMIVTWEALVSYLFDDDYKSSCEEDQKAKHNVKLFLSLKWKHLMKKR